MNVRVRCAALVSGLGLLMSLGAGSAVASTVSPSATVHPDSAAKCSGGNCVEVVGTGLTVTNVEVSEAAGHIRSGYYFAEVIEGSKHKWYWTNWLKGFHVVDFPGIRGKFPNDTLICGGVEPTKQPLDYNAPCVKVHK